MRRSRIPSLKVSSNLKTSALLGASRYLITTAIDLATTIAAIQLLLSVAIESYRSAARTHVTPIMLQWAQAGHRSYCQLQTLQIVIVFHGPFRPMVPSLSSSGTLHPPPALQRYAPPPTLPHTITSNGTPSQWYRHRHTANVYVLVCRPLLHFSHCQ